MYACMYVFHFGYLTILNPFLSLLRGSRSPIPGAPWRSRTAAPSLALWHPPPPSQALDATPRGHRAAGGSRGRSRWRRSGARPAGSDGFFLGLGDVNIWWLYCIYIYHMYIYSIYIYIYVCVRVFQYILNAYLKKYANAYNTYVYINMCIYICIHHPNIILYRSIEP